MKKRLLCMILTLTMIFCLVPSAAAAVSDEAAEAAEALYELGLFKGTGTNSDGTPIFDLDETPTRNQAIIMLVRLLGKEEEAKAGTWDIPFTDVSDAMRPYIGYAYTNGLTNGYTATTYCGGNPIKANQYIAFVLRSLGYESGKDFQVATSWKLADELGITKGQYANAAAFTRGDVAKISLKAHEIQETVATAPYWGLPADIKWIAAPTTDDDMQNNVLYSFLMGNYSLINPYDPDMAEWINNDRMNRNDFSKRLTTTYPELAGAYCNYYWRRQAGKLPNGSTVFFVAYDRNDKAPTLSVEQVYAQQKKALEAAQAIKNTLHQKGTVKDGMSQKQIAQAYYDYLRSFGVKVGGGAAEADQGKSVEFDSAYACLVNKKAACVGRAAAFNLLMHLEGISAQGVGGSIKGTNSGHVLNRVILDGETYYCDWGNNHPLAQNIDSWFIFD